MSLGFAGCIVRGSIPVKPVAGVAQVAKSRREQHVGTTKCAAGKNHRPRRKACKDEIWPNRYLEFVEAAPGSNPGSGTPLFQEAVKR